MNSKARLIVTLKCQKSCAGCCNNYNRIMSQCCTIGDKDIEWLADRYSEIVITGGEPFLFPELVYDLLVRLRKVRQNLKVYLYTATYNYVKGRELLFLLDGLQFSLHGGPGFSSKDIENLVMWQKASSNFPECSFRLYVDAAITQAVPIAPRAWNRIRIEPWKTEQQLLAETPNGLPPGEDLFLLKPGF